MAEKRRRQRLSEDKDPAVDASCGSRISVTATVLRRCVRHCRISRLPFINCHSYHSSGLSSSDIRLIPRNFEPSVAPSPFACEADFIVAQAGESRRSLRRCRRWS